MAGLGGGAGGAGSGKGVSSDLPGSVASVGAFSGGVACTLGRSGKVGIVLGEVSAAEAGACGTKEAALASFQAADLRREVETMSELMEKNYEQEVFDAA